MTYRAISDSTGCGDATYQNGGLTLLESSAQGWASSRTVFIATWANSTAAMSRSAPDSRTASVGGAGRPIPSPRHWGRPCSRTVPSPGRGGQGVTRRVRSHECRAGVGKQGAKGGWRQGRWQGWKQSPAGSSRRCWGSRRALAGSSRIPVQREKGKESF